MIAQSGTIFALAMIVSTALSTDIKLSAIIFFAFSLVYHLANLLFYQFLFTNVSLQSNLMRTSHVILVESFAELLYELREFTKHKRNR